MDAEAVRSKSALYPKKPGFLPIYGTGGFRTECSLLVSTAFRCGILAALRSAKTGKTTGCMITASHNPVRDNGMKLVDPSGGMLCLEWEAHAEYLARAESDQDLVDRIQDLMRQEGIEIGPGNAPPRVLFGRDTRPSSPQLLQAAVDGAQCVGAAAVDLGLTTTPQLHFAVLEENDGRSSAEDHYISVFLGAYQELMQGVPALSTPLIVDCANGVGGPKLRSIQGKLAEMQLLHLQLRNADADPQFLNDRCGSDHVQKEQLAPRGFTREDEGSRCCSIDGDADRLVYFRPAAPPSTAPADAPPPIHLLDGDRIAILAADYLGRLVQALPPHIASHIQVGVVQTAYANGASTRYLRESLRLDVVWAKTGVKHLHREAERFPIGIYFESNGHGTVLFKYEVKATLTRFVEGSGGGASDPGVRAAREILALTRLVNQAVGDALSCLLLVEVVLAKKGWTLADWLAMYTDLPSRQLKVVVPDRTFIRCSADESRAVQPLALQEEIEALAASLGPAAGARAFVRPSGTEDIVRVYAEASTQEGADRVAGEVAGLVKKHAAAHDGALRAPQSGG